MSRSVEGVQNVSRMCFVCGVENPFGAKGRFYELEGGELLGIFDTLPEHQGYPERVHGGISTALVEETIGRAVNLADSGSWGVTLELSVRFRRPVPTGEVIRAIGRITRDRGRVFEGSGELLLPDGTVAVEASGTYLRLPIDRIVDGDFESEWFEDDRPAPGEVFL